MAWDTTKVAGNLIQSADWNAQVTAIKKVTAGTFYWSCSGVNFKPNDTTDEAVFDDGVLALNSANGWVTAPVFLPHGAVVTACVVYGDLTGVNAWRLRRINISSQALSDLAGANVNTEDTTITNATIDNSVYGYYIDIAAIVNTDLIYGVRITYTL